MDSGSGRVGASFQLPRPGICDGRCARKSSRGLTSATDLKTRQERRNFGSGTDGRNRNANLEVFGRRVSHWVLGHVKRLRCPSCLPSFHLSPTSMSLTSSAQPRLSSSRTHSHPHQVVLGSWGFKSQYLHRDAQGYQFSGYG